MAKVRYLKPWYPPGVSEVLSGGNTARLGLLPDGTVLKYLFEKDDRHAKRGLDIEHSILLALGNHERLVKFLGSYDHIWPSIPVGSQWRRPPLHVGDDNNNT
jgi:hypothetical protein